MTLLVFTDLDGTLLDHQTYSFSAAQPALNELRRRGVPLVLASSKTAAEIEPLHEQLDLGGAPMIVENGAACIWPQQTGVIQDTDYRTIRTVLSEAPESLRKCFSGFGDMSIDCVIAHTGLSAQNAQKARKRLYSEPGIWSGENDDLKHFLKYLQENGVSARQGGRFLTLSLGGTKAGQMHRIIDHYRADVTIALGDAPNDIEMIQAADFGVIIKNTHSAALPPMKGEENARIRRSILPGPQGWNAAVLAILDELDRQEV